MLAAVPLLLPALLCLFGVGLRAQGAVVPEPDGQQGQRISCGQALARIVAVDPQGDLSSAHLLEVTPDARFGLRFSASSDLPQGPMHSILDLRTGVAVLDAPLSGAPSMAVSPDGRWGAVGYAVENRVELWDLGTGVRVSTALWSSDSEPAEIRALRFSPDSQWLAAASHNASGYVFPVGRDKLGEGKPFRFSGDVHDVQFSADVRWLFVNNRDGRVHKFPVTAPGDILPLAASYDPYGGPGILCLPGGRLVQGLPVPVGTSFGLRLWNTETDKAIAVYVPKPGVRIREVVGVPNSPSLVIAQWGHPEFKMPVVRMEPLPLLVDWDPDTGSVRTLAATEVRRKPGGVDYLFPSGVATLPNGWVVYGSNAGRLRFVDRLRQVEMGSVPLSQSQRVLRRPSYVPEHRVRILKPGLHDVWEPPSILTVSRSSDGTLLIVDDNRGRIFEVRLDAVVEILQAPAVVP